MRYLSVCSGIEAASVAWEPLGMVPVGFSEIDRFPCSVLSHRFPGVPNFGDVNDFEEWPIEPESVDILVGGTPCQSFSIAGLRGGLSDDRGNLALTYCRILQKFRPRWFVWENVPGVLSSNGGRDFGSILGAMVECGYSVSYRILDAQHFGIPQRRRRVFVVGHLGDWRRAAEVLFEPGCVRGNSSKGGKKRKDVTGTIASRTSAGSGLGTDFDLDGGLVPSSGVKYAYYSHDYANDRITDPSGVSPALTSLATASGNLNVVTSTGHTSHCLNAGGMGRQDYETETMVGGFPGVRRLTPVECEKLQGFPPDWTLVPHRGKPAADGPRYKAIGNSMAVPVMRWIGQRIISIHKEF